MVTVIIPCRNERDYIQSCLDSVIKQDYPKKELEILIVDGMSEDGTREFIKNYARKHRSIRTLDNPERTKPCALNMSIKNAKGDIQTGSPSTVRIPIVLYQIP